MLHILNRQNHHRCGGSVFYYVYVHVWGKAKKYGQSGKWVSLFNAKLDIYAKVNIRL